MTATEPNDPDLQGHYLAIEMSSHEELDSMLGMGGSAVFPGIPVKEKCKLLRCLFSARLGNQVTRVWVEGRGHQVSYVARFAQGVSAEGKFADLKTADADADSNDCKLPDLPSDILRVIVGLVVKEPEDGLRMMGICGRIRKIVLDEKLPVMTNLSSLVQCDDDLRSYNRVVTLINLSGSWLQSVEVNLYADVSETRAEGVTALLLALRDLTVYQNGDDPWILSQFASVAPNVQRLTASGNFSEQAMDWIRRLPLEDVDLGFYDDCWVSGAFLSSQLKSLKLTSGSLGQMHVSAQLLMSILRRSGQTLLTLKIYGVSIRDDCNLNSFGLDDCQCTFIAITHITCSDVFLSKLCHRNLTHLHLLLDDGQAALGETLFENGRFSLRKVQLGFRNEDNPTNAMRALLSHSPFLEVVSFCTDLTCTLPSSFADVKRLYHLRVFCSSIVKSLNQKLGLLSFLPITILT